MDDLDHRNLGARLDLWHIQEDAPGMVFWHPRGYALYRILEDYIRRKMRQLGYAEVKTPQLLPRSLWVQSGHWEKFGGNMFSVAGDERPMALKPMSCPCHVQIFNKRLRSWRELPLRYAEFGACHRNEPSGSLHGLMRTRGFEQDDAHVFCREEDVAGEVARFVTLLREVYAELGFSDTEVALSTRPLIRAGTDALWDWAEEALGNAARVCGLMFDLQPGEGAFYGPKLDFALRDRLGRAWQCGTIQLDSVLPHRLDASYVRPDGSRAVPVMIHHAVFGAIGRLIAILLEHYQGALPFWLSPDQVAVAPISQDHAAYAAEVLEAFAACAIRAVLLGGAETLSRRIVAAHEASIPVVAVVGRRESEQRTVSLRERTGNSITLTLEDAAATLSRRQMTPVSKLCEYHSDNTQSK
jgi:threonyl-tRNA synthetase